jgi:hypothetical protein
MAETSVKTMEVKALTKYGFQNEAGEYVGWSKNLKESEKTPVIPGRVFSFEIYTADSSKQYVNKVLKQMDTLKSGDTPKATVNTVKVTPQVPKPVMNVTPQVTDWAAKDRSQLIGGLSHDAATLTAAIVRDMPDLETDKVLELYHDFLAGMLKIRDKVK